MDKINIKKWNKVADIALVVLAGFLFGDKVVFPISSKSSAQEVRLENKIDGYIPILPIDYSYLITDKEFTDSSYLTQEQVQKFLEQKKSVLSYKIKEKLFSEEIIKVSKKYQINPLLLLARAQVEQGLVSAKQADEEKISKIMGYGCFDNGKTFESSLGFIEQIENSARILRKHYDSFNNNKGAIELDNGKTKIMPKNGATWALLKYTPWTENGGNQLFRKVYDSYKKELEN